MFNEFVEARAGESGRKSWAIMISALCQAGTLLALLLVPLVYTDALPNALKSIQAMFAPVTPLVEAPKPPAETIERPKVGGRIIRPDGGIRMPTSFPTHPQIFVEEPLPPELPAGTDFSVRGLFDLAAAGPEAAEPAAPVAAVTPPRIRQPQIEAAMILSAPQPVYPKLALIAGIQGDVFLHAIIDREGRIAELEVTSGHPLLARAALDAVRTWRYRPTLLNGEPVEVETTIRVSFVLGR